MKQLPARYKPDSEAYRIQLLQLRDATDQELVRVERRENFHAYNDRGLGEASLGLIAAIATLCFLTTLMTWILLTARQPTSVLLINSGGEVERVQ